MKKALVAIYGIFALAYLPISIYGSWLLYQHIHATELMWFIWWISIPVLIVASIISNIVFKLIKE